MRPSHFPLPPVRPSRIVSFCLLLLSSALATPAFAGGKVAADSHDSVVSPLPPPPPPSPSPSPSPSSSPRAVPPPPSRAASMDASLVQPSTESETLGHSDDPAFKLGALLGYSTNDLNLGVGIRAGKNYFLPHLYVGGTFVYQLGHSVSSSVGGTTVEASLSAFYLGPEVGYDFYVAPVVVRVYAGLGIAGITASSSVGGATSVSDTSTKFVIWPGAEAIYEIPDSSFFVAADTRFLTVPGGPAVGLFAMGGTRF